MATTRASPGSDPARRRRAGSARRRDRRPRWAEGPRAGRRRPGAAGGGRAGGGVAGVPDPPEGVDEGAARPAGPGRRARASAGSVCRHDRRHGPHAVVSSRHADPLDELRALALPDWERRRRLPATSATRWPTGIAKITICRPEVRNAFRPQTLFELTDAFDAGPRRPRRSASIVLTGEGPDAFCSGGDQRIRGDDGYIGDDEVARQGIGRLNVLDLQIQIRRLPKPVVAMVAGYAIGGGHVLHLVCDLTIAADNARFGQTGPEGRQLRRRLRVGPAGPDHRAEAGQGDLVPLPPVRRRAGPRLGPGQHRRAARPSSRPRRWPGAGGCSTLSPIALRMLKAGFNAADDGLAGIQQLAGDATMLFYMTEEGQEGRNAYVERRRPTSPASRVVRDRGAAEPGAVTERAASAGIGPALGPRGPAADPGGRRRAGGRRDGGRLVAAADRSVGVIWWRAVCALVVALAVQVGTNYANDYSDGVRGTDDGRVGPAAAGRLRAGLADGGAPGGPRSPSAWPPWPAWPWPPPPAGG